MKTYVLLEKDNRRLGDKTEFFYELHQNGQENNGEIIVSIKELLERGGIKAGQVLNDPEKFQMYEHIRRQTGLTASRQQKDVLMFIEEMIKIIEG